MINEAQGTEPCVCFCYYYYHYCSSSGGYYCMCVCVDYAAVDDGGGINEESSGTTNLSRPLLIK